MKSFKHLNFREIISRLGKARKNYVCMSYIGPLHLFSFRKLCDHPMVEACLHTGMHDWNMGPIGMP